MSHEPTETSLTSEPAAAEVAVFHGAGILHCARCDRTDFDTRRRRTDRPAWTARALAGLDELLVDHAHCEKKAAGTALNLIFRYPRHAHLLEPLSRLAREELVHFEQVLALLRARGVAFAAQKPAPYAGRLRAATRARGARSGSSTRCCAAR